MHGKHVRYCMGGEGMHQHLWSKTQAAGSVAQSTASRLEVVGVRCLRVVGGRWKMGLRAKGVVHTYQRPQQSSCPSLWGLQHPGECAVAHPGYHRQLPHARGGNGGGRTRTI